jgi:hypothetical protein
MSKEEKILTLHPQGKKGVRISKKKYDVIKAAMLECLKSKELTHLELMDCIEKRLHGYFEGSIGWYSESVKLDLEARKIIERQLEVEPQTYRLKE